MPPIELIEKRTRNSKTHHLGGRKYAWDGTIGSIHYSENGEWKDIDNAFEPALVPWDWQMLKAGYHIRVKEDFTAGQIIEFSKLGESVQFQPIALEWTNDLDQIQLISMPQDVAPVITNPEVDLLPAVGMPSHQGTIRWDDAYGEGLDFRWRCTTTRLIKILEVESLNKLPVPEQYILDGGNPVLRLSLIFDPSKDVDIYVDDEVWDRKAKKQTFSVIEFRKDGEVLWGFLPLRYWDSGEVESERSMATLEKRGNKLYISIRVPYDWLQTATYPVFIDTDIDVSVAAGGDDGCCEDGTFDATGDYLQVGYYIDHYNAWYRFDGVTIPQTSTVGVAYLELWEYNTDGSPLTKIYAEKANDPNAPSNCTDLGNRTRTDAGVDEDGDPGGTGYHETTSIVSVIQELVTAYEYSNQAIQILHDDDGSANGNKRQSYSYDKHPNYTPKLHIEYEVAGGVNYPIATSCGLAVSAAIDRDIAWDRGMSPSLAVAVTIAAVFGRLITTIANLTVNAIIDREVAYKRASSPGLTAAVTVLKGWGRAIATTTGLTVSTTIGIVRGFVRPVVSALAVSVVVDRDIAYSRATTPGLTVLATIDRKVAYKRATQAALAIAVTIIKTLGRAIATSPGLTVSITIAKSWGRIISTSVDLAISATISRAVAYKRSVSTGLTTAVTITRQIAKLITTNTALVISVTISKVVGYVRATNSNLELSVSIVATIVGAVHYLISTITNLSISTSVVKTVVYNRAFQPALLVAVSVLRVLGVAITISANLTISATIARAVAYQRATQTGLLVAVSVAWHQVISKIRRFPILGYTLGKVLPFHNLGIILDEYTLGKRRK